MSDTNWKKLGKKQGANMKTHRNVRMDKAFYNNGKWDTFYTDDDIKRLAYYNVDLPHVVGIGTKTPFSKLSFGDSTDSGHHITTDTITPGKVTAIAMHEKSISKAVDGSLTNSLIKGQDFAGFSYVNNIKSIRKRIDEDKSASGIAIYANKSSEDNDTSLKTDKAVVYVTDDNYVHIGGVPKEFNLIDPRGPPILPGNSQNSSNVLTGPNILLDVSGSIHVNGFINFLRNGNTADRFNDNPAGQLTHTTESGIIYVDESEKDQINNRAVPDGAIWVGFNKKEAGAGNYSLVNKPRLYIQYEGENTKVLTEKDTDIISSIAGGGGAGGTSGLTWAGDNDSSSQNPGEESFYLFRQPSDDPGSTMINTFIGRANSNISNAADFTKNNESNGNPLPRLLKGPGNTIATPGTDSTASALTIVGNLSVFDFTTGGTNGTELTGLNADLISDYKAILQSDIYNNAIAANNQSAGQGELGSIYTDRHIMIGGMQGDLTTNARFQTFSSAIDISGGIFKKPAIRVLTGSNNGTLVASGKNCRDSIIVGNTLPDDFTGPNTESVILGEHAKIDGLQNSIVQGNNNNITDISNSLVIGKNLTVGQSGTTMDGVVALGVGPVTVDGDERIVFATNDGTTSMKALTIDKKGSVTIFGDLNVQGDEIILDVEHKVVQDGSIKLAGKDGEDVNGDHETKSSGSLTSAGATTNPPATEEHEAGLKIFIHKEDDTNNFVQWTFDERNNDHANHYDNANNHTSGNNTDADRWTTAMSSRPIGIAAAANTAASIGTERFKVLNNGDLQISSDGTSANNKFTIASSTGNTVVEGSLTVNNSSGIILEKDETITNSTDGTVLINGELAAGTGTAAGVFKSNGSQDVILKTGNTTTGSITITDGTAGNITLAPNGGGDVNLETDTVKIGDTNENVTITTNGTGDLTLNTNNGSSSGSIKIEDGTNKNITIAPNGTGKIVMFGEHNPNTSGAHFEKNGNKVDLLISGKLTVDGLIDPTGLILDSATAPGNADVNGKLGLYFDGSGALKTKTFDGTNATETTLATTADISEITSGTGGTNVNSANKIKVTGTNTGTKKILFATGSNGNQQVFYDSNSLSYNASTNTLTTTTFSGALTGTATKASNLSFASGATSGFVKWDSTTDQISTDTSTYLTSVPQEDVEDIVGGMLEGTQSGITVSYSGNGTSAGNLNFDVNKSITLDNDADKVIKIADQTTTGAGRNLTIQAGKGKSQIGGNLTLKAGNADGATNIGGNLILQAGDGDSDDEDGEIRLVGISRSDGDNILSIDTLGNISGAPKIIGFQDADATISFEGERDDGDGRKLTIKAGSVGDGTHNGGDLELKGGDGNGIGSSAGNVNITGNEIHVASSTSGGSNLTIDSGTGWSELKLNATSTNATDHHNYISSVNQKLKFLAGPNDDDCVLTIEKTPKGTITLGEGTDTGIGTPTLRTKQVNQGLMLDAAGPLELKSKEARAINFHMRNTNLEGDDSTSPNNGASYKWKDITSSADGKKLAAVAEYGNIWTSNDSGATWTEVNYTNWDTTQRWFCITSSADGTKLAAGVYNGNIWRSTDSGQTWTEDTSVGATKRWTRIASSADGQKVVAVPSNDPIYRSTNGGASWAQLNISKSWKDITSSADGTKLAAVVSAGNIWTSSDSGANWTEVNYTNWDTTQGWRAITSSADGTSLAAVVSGGNIWTSEDSGQTWTEDTSVGATKEWINITSSACGTLLVAAEEKISSGSTGGGLFFSNDGGINWDESTDFSGKNWRSVATSSDGTRIVAGVYDGKIFRIHRGNLIGIDSPSPVGTLTIGDGNSQAVPSLGNMMVMGMTEGTSNGVRRWMGMTLDTDVMLSFGDCGIGTDPKKSLSKSSFRIHYEAPPNTLTLRNGNYDVNGNLNPNAGGKDVGLVGINLPLQSAAGFPLEVEQPTSGASIYGPEASVTGKYYSSSGEETKTNYDTKVTIVSRGDVWSRAGAFVASSDERIKENITEVPDNLALQKLRDISCCYYEYKDKISRGTQQTIGFIAQQVKQHLPMAVSIQRSIIPNEMRVLEANWDGMNMSSDLTDVSGVKYRFYVNNDPSGNDQVKKEIVGNEDNTFTFDKKYNTVFCYGKEVDDFHIVNKQKIFAVNFSATQEIDKIQQEEKTKLAAAEERITVLETENAALKAQLNSIEARLAALEA